MNYQVSENHQTLQIPLKDIFSDGDFNCRGSIAPFDVIDLATDIEKNTLLQPICIRPYVHHRFKFKIITGHRRYQAFRNLERDTIPCIIKEGLSEEQQRVLNLSENIKRTDLNILQEAKALKYFQEKGYTFKKMAKEFKVSTGWVQCRLNLLRLPTDVQQAAAAGYVNPANFAVLLSMPKHQMYRAVRDLTDKQLRGEKGKKINKEDYGGKPRERPNNVNTRYKLEILEIQKYVMEYIGPSFAARLLGWAACEITTEDVMKDIQEECNKYGKTFFIPKEYRTDKIEMRD